MNDHSPNSLRAIAHRKHAHSYRLIAEAHNAEARALELEGKTTHAATFTGLATQYELYAKSSDALAASFEEAGRHD